MTGLAYQQQNVFCWGFFFFYNITPSAFYSFYVKKWSITICAIVMLKNLNNVIFWVRYCGNILSCWVWWFSPLTNRHKKNFFTALYILGTHLRFDVKGGPLFNVWFMVPQNHTADAVFNFLATRPSRVIKNCHSYVVNGSKLNITIDVIISPTNTFIHKNLLKI